MFSEVDVRQSPKIEWPPISQMIAPLSELSLQTGNSVFALLGSRFPSGSLKFISVLGMMSYLRSTKKMDNVQHVVGSTSGNTGLAAATLFRDSKIRFHAVIDSRTVNHKKMELKRLGAEVIEIEHPDPTWIAARLRKTSELSQSLPNCVDLDQYANPGALQGHFTCTGPLIWQAMLGQIDVLVAPIGTGGTFGGIAHFLRRMNPNIATVPVDCEGSVVIGGQIGPHLLTGIGAHIRCLNAHRAFTAAVGMPPRVIGDAAAIRAAHRLHAEEGIWVGGSSGAALAAATDIAHNVHRKRIVVICPDGGESYMDTIYSSTWLSSNGLSV